MSLTFLARLTVFLVALAIAATAGWRYGPEIGSYIAEAQSSTTIDADIDGRAIVYRLEQDRSLRFNTTQPVNLVRVLAQAAVKPELRAREAGFRYAVEVTMFDREGTEVARQLLHLHADAPDVVFASGDSWRFFRNSPEMVAGMDDVVIETPSPVVRSEWRLVSADAGILAVDVRVYERQPVLPSQALASFRRRSDKEQLDLAVGNAFPPELMSTDEMANVIANQWKPLGPQGIAGRDYRARVLYEGMRRDLRGAPGR